MRDFSNNKSGKCGICRNGLGLGHKTSRNAGISSSFLTFSLDLFARLHLNFKAISRTIPELLNLNKDHSSHPKNTCIST